MKNFTIFAVIACALCALLSCTDTFKNDAHSSVSAVPTTLEIPRSENVFYSPCAIAVAPDSKSLYLVEYDHNQIRKIDAITLATLDTYPTAANPTGIAISKDGKRIFVTTSCPDGKLIEYNADFKIVRVIDAGHSPCSPVLSPDEVDLALCDRFVGKIMIFDTENLNDPPLVIKASREPISLIFSPDGNQLFAANALPPGPADGDSTAAELTIVDFTQKEYIGDGEYSDFTVTQYPLINGAINMRHLAISPDGKYVMIPLIVARYQVPTTRIDRAWLGTNSIAMFDIQKKKLYTTFPLDDGQLGATNPWDIKFSNDGKTLITLIAGSDELITIDYDGLIAKLDQRFAEINTTSRGRIKPPAAPDDELGFIFDLRVRSELNVRGPRCMALINDSLYIPGYFSDDIDCLNLTASREVPPQNVKYGLPFEKLPAARRGESYFNDGKICFQQWLSCITCHPDGRADGLNWDLINDGFGNPKNTKSMLFSIYTPPCMSTGIRENAEYAIRSGVKHIQFFQPEASFENELYGSIEEYYKVMKAVPSPYLNRDGSLSASAERGKVIFENAGCVRCHNGPYLTNMRQYDVGTTKGKDKGRTLDTPTLMECWRTAPYMHDGRTSSLRDVVTVHNPQMRGDTKNLSDKEVDDLVQYLLSL